MTKPELALAECLDAWQQGDDPEYIIERHPDLAGELRALVQTARRVRAAARAASLEPLPSLPASPRLPAQAPRQTLLRQALQHVWEFLVPPAPALQPLDYRRRYKTY